MKGRMFFYKWFPQDWLSNETRLRMTPLERSIYRDLLDHNIVQGDLPDNEAVLSQLAAVSLTEFRKAWPAVAVKFIPVEGKPGRISNPRALGVVQDFYERSETNSQNGSIGGRRSGEARREKTKRSLQEKEANASRHGEASINRAEQKQPQTPLAGIDPAMRAAFERCVELHPNPDPDAACRALISLVSAGALTDPALLEPAMRLWLGSELWSEGKGQYSAEWRSLSKWLERRAWLSKPAQTAAARSEARSAERRVSSRGDDPNAEYRPEWRPE